MSENNNNIVDGDVEVLDLAELEQATGGAVRAIGSFQKLDTTQIRKIVGALAIGGARVNPGILMANDGWQTAGFNLQPNVILQRG